MRKSRFEAEIERRLWAEAKAHIRDKSRTRRMPLGEAPAARMASQDKERLREVLLGFLALSVVLLMSATTSEKANPDGYLCYGAYAEDTLCSLDE